MQTLIDPFELGHSSLHSTKAYSTKARDESGPRLTARAIPPLSGARATLLDVDEIAWMGDDDDNDSYEITDEVMLDLDLENAVPRRQLPPRARGARVWTSED
jgi:hypothetical protein